MLEDGNSAMWWNHHTLTRVEGQIPRARTT